MSKYKYIDYRPGDERGFNKDNIKLSFEIGDRFGERHKQLFFYENDIEGIKELIKFIQEYLEL